MTTRRTAWFVSLLFLCSAVLGAQAPQRELQVVKKPGQVALVMGNDAYPEVPLRNAVNDARAMAGVLSELGFAVDLRLNTQKRTIERAVNEFVARLRPGDWAVFYYAGHGIQIEGENYLVPVDFAARDETDAKFESYSASRLQERVEATGVRLNLIILDACRNNPFTRSRSSSGGLAAMNSGRGTFIAFATAPGRTASDNPDGKNGLFTRYVVEALGEPGFSLDQVFNRVKDRVARASNNQQLPWTASSLTGEIYLRPGPALSASQERVAADVAFRLDLEYWQSIRDSSNAELYEAYLKQFPDGKFTSIAQARIREIRTAAPPSAPPQSQASIPSSAPPPAPKPSGNTTQERNRALNAAFNEGIEAKNSRQYAAAVKGLTTASEIDPSQHVVWANLADAYLALAGTKAGAELQAAMAKGVEAWTRAIALKPDDAGYHNNYAIALAKAGRLEESQAELSRAVQLDPPNAGRYYYNIGAILTNTGHSEPAGEAFRKAIEADPTFAEAHYQYGVYLMSKARVNADKTVSPLPGTREAFQRYLQWKPDGPLAAQARAILEAFK